MHIRPRPSGLRRRRKNVSNRSDDGGSREAEGGGLLIHPDLLTQTDFHLFCLCHEPLNYTESVRLQFIVQQEFSKNSVALLA